MAQDTPKNNSVSRSSLRSPPKAASASNIPAAALTGICAKNSSPGKNTAAAYPPPSSAPNAYLPRRSGTPASRPAESNSR